MSISLTSASSRRAGILSAVLWVIFALMLAKHTGGVVRSAGVPIAGNDFPAFYCAGLVAREHGDPYRVEPLRGCEHMIPNGSDQPAAFVTPAPLPGYALAVFTMLSLLPYKTAAWLWFAVLAGAVVTLALLLAKIARIPSGVAAIVLLFSAALAIVVYGQLPVLAVLGISIAGIALSRRPSFALFGIALGMIEPHVGIAAALGCYILVPGLRIKLSILALLLAAASIGVLGVHGNLEYFLQVLPTHARAELGAIDQFSFSHLATYLGFGSGSAAALGTLSYLVMLALGIAFAKPLAEKLEAPEAIVYLPVAAVLFGGSFLHEIQLIAALPLAFLIAGYCVRQRSGARGLPLQKNPLFLTSVAVIVVVALVPFTLYQEHHSAPLQSGAQAQSTIRTLGAQYSPAAVSGAADASANWGLFLTTDPAYAERSPGAEAAKVPFWGTLFFLLATIVGSLRTKRDVVPANMPVRHWLEGPEIRIG